MKVTVGSPPQTFYMDRWLVSNLELLRKRLRNDDDLFIIVSGIERTGKSVLAMQVGFFLDPTLTLDRICFSGGEFKKVVKKADKFSTVIFDEAARGARAASWASEVNQHVAKLSREMGQRNLAVILVIPSFFEMSKYFAIHRSVLLLHVKRDSRGYRGEFKFFNRKKKQRLYLAGKQTYDYDCSPPDFVGRFTDYYPLDEKAYRKKKEDSFLNEDLETELPAATRYRSQRDNIIKWVVGSGLTNSTDLAAGMREQAVDFPLSRRQISRIPFTQFLYSTLV